MKELQKQSSTVSLSSFAGKWNELKRIGQEKTQQEKERLESELLVQVAAQVARITPLNGIQAPGMSKVRAMQGEAKENALEALSTVFTILFRQLHLWYGEKWKLTNAFAQQQVIEMIRESYYWLSPQEVAYVFKQGMRGKYGKSYNVVDGELLIGWLADYDANERAQVVEMQRGKQPKEPEPPLLEALEQTPEQRAKMQAALDNLKAPKKPDTNTKPDIRQAAYRGAMAALTEEQRAKVQRWKAATSVDDGPQTEQEQMLWVQFHEDVSERMATASTRENERYQKYSQWLGRFKDGQAPTFQEFEKMFG